MIIRRLNGTNPFKPNAPGRNFLYEEDEIKKRPIKVLPNRGHCSLERPGVKIFSFLLRNSWLHTLIGLYIRIVTTNVGIPTYVLKESIFGKVLSCLLDTREEFGK